MKFSNVLMFASFAFAAPAAVEVRQQQTVTGVVLGSTQTLLNTVNTNVDAIKTAINGAGGNIGASVQAQIRANLQAILAELQTAATTISGATAGAAGGIVGAATGLTQQQINDLAQAVQNTLNAVAALNVLVTAETTNLTGPLGTFAQTEINAIRAAISPFAAPVITFARAVQAFSARVGVTVTGLAAVTTSLTSYITNLLNSLGLGLSLPLIPGASKRAAL
ncbi:unnamed protein product [Clonostachys rosea]|uniref:Uncharacterized protein n=1 Tax=Bionectria ochroleuca TaxID=29856 RepID=A0ABY6UAG1_BIOOC|nr:unnamed protein product [Clonostachys rosea]